MEQVLIGLALALIGILICFFGLRLWFFALPLIGGLVGFYIGARFIHDIAGTGFLATAAAWLSGLVLGFLFALGSWFLWYAGVLFLAAAAGALLASGLLHALFSEPWGWVLFVVTLVGAVVVTILAFTLHLPSQIIVITSAFVGAALTVAGGMTMLGTITVAELANGVAIALVDEFKYQGASWLWAVGWIVLTIAGIAVQYLRIAEARLPEERWVRAYLT